MKKQPLVVILGPTATGKTPVGTLLAHCIGGEIISADSRQVYRGMDLGTGKDLVDYTVNGVQVPYHLIDIVDAGYKYNLFEFKRDAQLAIEDIASRDKTPILCGGTGLYIESILKNYNLQEVPVDPKLREQLEGKSLEELTQILKAIPNHTMHNTTDVDTAKRAIRAIEIAQFSVDNSVDLSIQIPSNSRQHIIFGIDISRELRRERISNRLMSRFDNGMIEEVRRLIDAGVTPEDLIYYGLEYKFITQHVIGELTFDEMYRSLEVAIHQFAKRQMTWFRGMERRGFTINWIDGTLSVEERVEEIRKILAKN